MAAFLARCLDSTRSARSLADEVRIVLTRNKLGRRAVHHILTASERKVSLLSGLLLGPKQTTECFRRPSRLQREMLTWCARLELASSPWPTLTTSTAKHSSGLTFSSIGIGGDNLVVVDLRTLGLSDGRLEQLVTLVVATLGPLNDECWHQTLQTASEIFVGLPTKEPDDKPLESGNEDQVIPSLRGMLRFQGTFGETKNMCRASLDICHSFLVDNGIELTKPWWTVD
ncbi:uncharacterized protein LOC9650041 isoform X1 [Selaginella moellendorffii]|uniref:uncharacterized protein LOC9650041 isoform X1 n=1 Tax=Selaginella moellendorffii TaxID=88036 RepID=UPI000D1CA71E|nr:uncharacterized protein LOC9650041 isoform X1 [Selaginella moellendorffii]|eukprot:XP_024518763.1 uncharacterized protein LOC9650041 isoform X1 [Selaginella moellendorffii]